jgi:hypothetical protein
MINEINLKKGKITFNDFNINFEIPLDEQIFSLKEDLLQINYNEKYIIDVGWHPELDPKGFFKVQVIKDYDWLNPIFIKKCKSKKSLQKSLQKAVDIICP